MPLINLPRPAMPIAVVMLAAAAGFAGNSLGSSPVANAADTASANTTAAALKISPSEFPTCAESFEVTFSVSGFAANSSVNLEIGATKAESAAAISTNASGAGSITLEFGVGVNSHDYFPGDYKIFATQSALEATKTLTVSACG
jgi:hypothetical protein